MTFIPMGWSSANISQVGHLPGSGSLGFYQPNVGSLHRGTTPLDLAPRVNPGGIAFLLFGWMLSMVKRLSDEVED